MKILTRFIAVLLLACAACTGADREQVGQVRTALRDPTHGFVAFPAALGSDGKPMSLWDGSLVDLLAADAWSICLQGTDRSTVTDAVGDAVAPYPNEADTYWQYLMSRMDTSRCGANVGAKGWYLQRQILSCNYNLESGDQQPLQTFAQRSRAEYRLPNFGASLVASGTGTQARQYAQEELDYADVNLCMAYRLREQLEGPVALFASVTDQQELVRVIRERSHLATLQYGLLARVAVATDVNTSLPVTVTSANDFGKVLKLFFDKSTVGTITRLADDYAAAVNLLVESTHQMSELLLREASARTGGAAAPSRAEADWGVASPRAKLITLIYGARPERSLGILQSMREPQVSTLLGLARGADVIDFRRPDNQTTIDAPKSAERMYRAVEASVRKQQCLRVTPGSSGCDFTPTTASIPNWKTQYGDYEIYRQFQLLPSHAETLVNALTPLVNASTSDTVPIGPMHLFGVWSAAAAFDGDGTAVRYHLSKDFRIQPVNSAILGYGALTSYWVPQAITAARNVREQGFVARQRPLNAFPFRGMRDLGSVPALVLTREALLEGKRQCVGVICSMFDPLVGTATVPGPTIQAVEEAVGGRTTTLRASASLETSASSTAPCGASEVDDFVAVPCMTHLVGLGAAPTTGYTIDITTNADPRAFGITVASDDSDITTAALMPGYVGLTASKRASLDALATFATNPAVNYVGGQKRLSAAIAVNAFNRPHIFLRSLMPPGSSTTFAYALAGQVKVGTQLLFNGVARIRPDAPHYLSYGGSLNAIASRALATKDDDWSRPRNDAFGIPVDWVPPTDAGLLGASPGEDAVSYYLRRARAAAEEATAAVKTAVDGIVEQAEQQSALQAAEERALTISKLEYRALCGDKLSDTQCKFERKAWAPSVGTLCLQTDPTEAAWCQKASTPLTSLVPASLPLAGPVVDAGESTPSSFPDYEGGELQGLFIRQWDARRKVQETIKAAFESAAASAKDVIAAEAALTAAQGAVTATEAIRIRECSDAAYLNASQAGRSYSDSSGAVRSSDETSFEWSASYEVMNWSPGPLFAQRDRCLQQFDEKARLEQALPPMVAQNAALVAQAWSTLNDRFGAVSDAVGVLLTTISEISAAQQRTDVAVARSKLETSLAQQSFEDRFRIQRRYRSHDMWRARALLESARRLAVTARRAIESRFVVDLSELRAPESFVAAPALWADEIYGVDLQAPAAVGVALGPASNNDAVYPNKLVDYVGNLERFVEGYAINRPTAVARADVEVLALPGPDVRREVIDAGVPNVVLDQSSFGWQFACADAGGWVNHPAVGQMPLTTSLSTLCANQGPARAKYTFALDPWGRIGGSISNPPFDARHNARWRRFVVNIVGTGVRNCELAPVPVDCYSESFLRYDLQHIGPAWVTDFTGTWRALSLPIAVVEQGKALAIEEWLDPISNGWEQPAINNAVRYELAERPLGGTYELVIDVTRDVDLSSIERLQVLLESEYWVRQR